MNITIHTVNEYKIAEVIAQGVVIASLDDAVDLVGNLYYDSFDAVILYQKNLTPSFFDLKNKLAGDILQKFSNYRLRLAIIGNFDAYTSTSITDFIYESNKGRQINFVDTLSKALLVVST